MNLARKVIDKMISEDSFSQWLGIEVLEITEGFCKLKMTIRDEMTNGFNIAHGGISYSLADSALAFAANSDGIQSTMCGNGGRCIISFAAILEIIDNEATFMAVDGAHKGHLLGDVISLKMNDVESIEGMGDGLVLDTGSPHYLELHDDISNLEVSLNLKPIEGACI